jgi:hypothetical protein
LTKYSRIRCVYVIGAAFDKLKCQLQKVSKIKNVHHDVQNLCGLIRFENPVETLKIRRIADLLLQEEVHTSNIGSSNSFGNNSNSNNSNNNNNSNSDTDSKSGLKK